MTTPELDLTVFRLGRRNALSVGVVVPEDAPPTVREGLARRRIVNAGGVCPCGAKFRMPGRAARRKARRAGEMLRVQVFHEDGCPAIDESLLKFWGAS